MAKLLTSTRNLEYLGGHSSLSFTADLQMTRHYIIIGRKISTNGETISVMTTFTRAYRNKEKLG